MSANGHTAAGGLPSIAPMLPAHSATLALHERLTALRQAGAPVLHLGFGEAGLPVPPGVADVLARAAARPGSNGYAPVAEAT